jgi:hypothetical protein
MLWSPTGKATNLGAILGSSWTDTYAVGINNSGDIIGNGYYHGVLNGFLLTPDSLSAAAAPELATWVMLLAGFASLSFASYRRARKGNSASLAS